MPGALPSLGLPVQRAQAAAPPERILPDTTVFMLKLNDAKSFREAFRRSQYGQLWNDPALKDFRDELGQKLAEATKALKEKIGVSLSDLVQLPQGTLAVAAIAKEAAREEAAASGLPVDVVLLADAGENEKKMLEVLERSHQAGRGVGRQGLDRVVQRADDPHRSIPAARARKKPTRTRPSRSPIPPLIWTNAGSLFFIATDLDVIKDLAAHREGRDNSLAATEAYTKTQAKTDSAKSQVIWYLDVNKLVKIVIKANSQGSRRPADRCPGSGTGRLRSQIDRRLPDPGQPGSYDSLTKTFVHAPKPVPGLLKVFSLPPISLRPESWVPATVASYQTVSFDLDNAFTALNEIVNKFQPGMVNLVEQQLVGPNGGQPLSFQNDVFGPLGDRITVISDFKKPIKEDSQRMLVAVSLEDTKAFQNTLSRLLEIAGAAPEKREFQGTTIYDFDVNIPNQAAGAPQALNGPISMAIAKDTLFVTTDTTLLEQVLRPGNPTLADSAVVPERRQGVSRKSQRIELRSPRRIGPALLRPGQERQVREGHPASHGRPRRGARFPNLGKIIPGDKLPDFSVFAKYLSLGRRLQRHGRRRLHDDRIHPPAPRPVNTVGRRPSRPSLRRARNPRLAAFVWLRARKKLDRVDTD